MERLGFRLTYRTHCRECGAEVYFHTNGDGSAVLFDELGPPWPIHCCYLAYFEAIPITKGVDPETGEIVAWVGNSGAITVRKDRRHELQRATDGYSGRLPSDTQTVRLEPKNFQTKPIAQLDGVVAAVLPGHWEARILALPMLAQRLIGSVLGRCRSQLTIIDFDGNSMTACYDSSRYPELAVGDVVRVSATAKAIAVDEYVFLIRSLNVLLGK